MLVDTLLNIQGRLPVSLGTSLTSVVLCPLNSTVVVISDYQQHVLQSESLLVLFGFLLCVLQNSILCSVKCSRAVSWVNCRAHLIFFPHLSRILVSLPHVQWVETHCLNMYFDLISGCSMREGKYGPCCSLSKYGFVLFWIFHYFWLLSIKPSTWNRAGIGHWRGRWVDGWCMTYRSVNDCRTKGEHGPTELPGPAQGDKTENQGLGRDSKSLDSQ